jgi:hypothetical protein
MALTTHPLLTLMLKKSRAIPLLPHWAFVACSRAEKKSNVYLKEVGNIRGA